MSTFGNVSEVWMVVRRGVAINVSNTTSCYTSEKAAMDAACQGVSREGTSRYTDMAVYRCELIADVVTDEPRVIDHRPTAMPAGAE